MWLPLGEVSSGAWDGLRYFIVALPEPSINYFKINIHYIPGIYADGYIVFVFQSSVRPFVCSFVRTSVTFVEFASKFCTKVSQVLYISATTNQKAFIFGP